jgi:hypothetical protein
MTPLTKPAKRNIAVGKQGMRQRVDHVDSCDFARLGTMWEWRSKPKSHITGRQKPAGSDDMGEINRDWPNIRPRKLVKTGA